MKSLMFLLFALVLLMACVSQQAAAREELMGQTGTLEYPFPNSNEHELVVWPDTSCTDGIGWSDFGAEIAPETKVTFIGRDLNRQDLDLLTGQRVCAYGMVQTTGEGEGTKEKFLWVTIVILPKR